jgi:hypothetical protein
MTVNAFLGRGGVSGVTIENLVIKNYNPGSGGGVIIPSTGGDTTNWLIKNNEISYANTGAGLVDDGGDQVVANYIHDNAQEGYKFYKAADAALTDNVIANNNPDNAYSAQDSNAEAGGGKSLFTTNLVVEYNYVHDNHGPGIWDDTDNQGTLIEYNDIENNWFAGILHEVSWDATIQNNFVKNNENATYCPLRNFWCAEITIANSGGVNGKAVDISSNTTIPSSYGAAIMLLNESRGSGLYGTFLVQNVHVHNNVGQLSAGGVNGAYDGDGTDGGMFTTQGNSFDYDVYTGAGSNSFFWSSSSGNFSFFQANGQESHGSSQ